MPRERKPSAKVREMQALEEEHGDTFDSLLQPDMIKEALAIDRQQKAGNDDDDDDDDGEEARLLLARAFAEEDSALEGSAGTQKRKKPAGTYRGSLAPKPKVFRLPRSAFSPLFLQIFTNSSLLEDLFLAPYLLSSSFGGIGGDLGALALTCKAFAPLLHRGSTEVFLTWYQTCSLLKYPARFIASLAIPGSAAILTTLHLFNGGLCTAELCYELGDVLTQGLPVLREIKFGKSHEAFTYTFIKLVNSTRLPALRTLILQNICLDTEARKAVLTALPVPKFGGNKPKGRGQAALMIHNPSSSSNSTSSTSLHTSFKPTTSTRTMLTLRPATPLLQLEHLVLRDICPIRPTWLQALFDCLAYHRVPLQTLECCRLYHCEGEVSMYDGLAAHLKIGNFPTLSSLTIYENGMRASAAVALIGGLDQGCPAVTSLSLESNYGRSSDYVSECGLLIKALSQASGHLHLSLQTPGLEELDVAEASEVLL